MPSTPKSPSKKPVELSKNKLIKAREALSNALVKLIPNTPELEMLEIMICQNLTEIHLELTEDDDERIDILEEKKLWESKARNIFFQLFDYERLKSDNEAGDSQALLLAIARAIFLNEPPPKWAGQGFLNAVSIVNSYQAGSWDEVFGKPHPPKTKRTAKLKKHRLALPIYLEIKKLTDDGKTYEYARDEVAKKYGLSIEMTRDYYYLIRNRFLKPLGLE